MLPPSSSGIIILRETFEPSEADKKLTRKIRDAGMLLDIDVLDHIIVVMITTTVSRTRGRCRKLAK